ncbi:hypothetical protein QQF64_025946 [Cirrhinus molitorella]|uniref:DUF4806 domain-containing protein n=1 Tax=Cirrhinus molitorella TaxID=172907 RepID=A0ABR3NQI8_9TELE
MNRKTVPVSSSAIRRRTHIDVDKRLKEIRDDCKDSADFQITTERDIVDVNRELESTDNPACPDSAHELFFSEEEGGMEVDADIHEDFVVGCPDRPIQTSDSENSDDELSETFSLSDSISNWAINFGISLVALTALLCILRSCHPDLPKDARTLLKTKTKYSILERAGGQYHYFGILTSIRNVLSKYVHTLADGFSLKLQINIDGLPLFKSSSLQLWPILGLLLSVPMKEPVVIGLFCGPKKPSSAKEFLGDFVTELQQLEKGFDIEGKSLKLELDTVICDSPARSFVKNTKNHNGYHGCDKCRQPGKYINGRMTYPYTDYALRTDDSFENMVDESHHHDGPHPFHGSSVGMVSQFPLDYMHLVCLGVVRRLLSIWLRGPLNFRLPANIVDRMSAKLVEMRSYIPVEFARKPRSLRELDRWKATELRQFLLYTDDYFEARRLLKKSLMCNTSDLQSEEEEEDNRPKRRPKPIHFFGDSDNESEEEAHHKKRARGPAKNLNKPVPVIPPPPFMPTSTAAPPPPTSPPEQQTPSTSQVYRPTWRGGRCGSDSISFLLNQAGEDMEMPENPVKFPLSSMEDLENFEEWLRNSSNNKMKFSVISSLASIGGHDTKHVTWNILSHMFHDDVGRRINWKGINGKRSFKELESQRFLLCAVRKNPVCRAATEDDIIKHAIRWFNLAADRGNARSRPSLNKK